MRGFESTSSQLSLPVERDGVSRVWEAMSVAGRERVLRLLAGVIGRVVSDQESDR